MHAIAKALTALPNGSYVLAVSGGRDSMALLHAFVELRPSDLAAVATFDHGTGVVAAQAVELVVRECLRLGVSVVAGRAPERVSAARPPEALLRSARWAFLRAVAEERGATIVTAHTRDDQAETVAMRILRDASARGLAGMAAPRAGVVRPLLTVTRGDVARYVEQVEIAFIDDPSNTDPAYLRNRLRADLLQAAEAAHPGFAGELIAVGERAAAWRARLTSFVDALGVHRVGTAVVVAADVILPLSLEGLAVIWPEVASRAGVVLDRRGVARLAAWSPRALPAQRIPLSGGAWVERTARTFVLHRASLDGTSGR
ncbi:MAG: tRNA lysidine(34) synthetase TilS [Gemmatimonadetes bacterium]|nr:tRNA lysidine(34) synthetase TilS [Gemmatimonadota bacterium]